MCGITDTFSRFPTDLGELGVSDSGREWGGVYLQHVFAQQGRSLGFLSEDWPADWPVFGYAPPQATFPGPFPVPFDGKITLSAADSFPGFSFPTEPGLINSTGSAWFGAGHITEFDELHLTTEPGVGSENPTVTSPNGLFNSYEPFSITGHIRVVQVVDHPGDDADKMLGHYVNITFQLGTISGGFSHNRWDGPYNRVWIGPSGGGPPTDYPDYGPDEAELIWTGEDEVEFDFELTYTGGEEGTFTLTIDGVAVSTELAAGILPSGTFAVDFFGVYNSNDEDLPRADLWLSNVRFNGTEITSAFGWNWTLIGEDTLGNPMRYSFSYGTFGGSLSLPIGSDEGYVDKGDPLDGYLAGVGPGMSVSIASLVDDRSVSAWLAFDEDLPFSITPFVTMNQFGASLQLGGNVVSVSAADATDDVGDSAPLGLLATLGSNLYQQITNMQGTEVLFDNLDITGVNACTEGVIPTPPGPIPNQPVPDEVVGVGDGVTLEFSTDWPYVGGTLRVEVSAIVTDVDNTDPSSGLFTFLDPPPVGAAITASYTAAAPTTPPVVPGAPDFIGWAGGVLDPRWEPLYAVGDPGYGSNSHFMGNFSQLDVVGDELIITAEYQATGLSHGRTYRSAAAATKDTYSFLYGVAEVELWYDNGMGIWPADWFLEEGSLVTPPEVDLLEAYPGHPGPIGGPNFISTAYHGTAGIQSIVYDTGADNTASWHHYRWWWTPGSMRYYFDGFLYKTMTVNVPSVPMYPILSLAVGAPGYLADGTTPATMTMKARNFQITEA